MASLPDFTFRFDEDQLQRLERVGKQISQRTLADVAFDYLLSKAMCTCVDQTRDPCIRCHDDQCVITTAIEISQGLRSWPDEASTTPSNDGRA